MHNSIKGSVEELMRLKIYDFNLLEINLKTPEEETNG